MKNRTFLYLLVSLYLLTPAVSQFQGTVTYHIIQEGNEKEITLYVRSDSLRYDLLSEDGKVSIILLPEASIILNHGEKVAIRVPMENQEMLDQYQLHLSLPIVIPELGESSLEILQQGGVVTTRDAEGNMIRIEQAGKRTVGQFPCTLWIFENSQTRELVELCLAKGEVFLPDREAAAELKAKLQKLSKNNEWFPVLLRYSRDGEIETAIQVTQFNATPPSETLFRPPADYQELNVFIQNNDE